MYTRRESTGTSRYKRHFVNAHSSSITSSERPFYLFVRTCANRQARMLLENISFDSYMYMYTDCIRLFLETYQSTWLARRSYRYGRFYRPSWTLASIHRSMTRRSFGFLLVSTRHCFDFLVSIHHSSLWTQNPSLIRPSF